MKFNELNLNNDLLLDILVIMTGQEKRNYTWELREGVQFVSQLGTFDEQLWNKANFLEFLTGNQKLAKEDEYTYAIVESRSATGSFRFIVSKDALLSIDTEKFLLYLNLVSNSRDVFYPPALAFDYKAQLPKLVFSQEDKQAFKEKCTNLRQQLAGLIEAKNASVINNPNSLFHNDGNNSSTATDAGSGDKLNPHSTTGF